MSAANALADYSSPPDGPEQGYQPRQLVLLGAGPGHLQVLAQLAEHPLIGVRITLVSPNTRQVHARMLAGFIAGHHSLDDCSIPIEPLVRRTGVRWLQRGVSALNTRAKLVELDDGNQLHYDWLSVNTGPVQNREQIDRGLPGARENGMFVHPVENFIGLWPKLAEMGAARALRIAVIGGDDLAMEIAMAVRQRLPNAALTLIVGEGAPGARFPAALQQRLREIIRARRITVIRDSAVRITEGAVHLGCGADLVCDVPLIAGEAGAAAWLRLAELQRDAHGSVATDVFQRSLSHPDVFVSDEEYFRAGHEGPQSDSAGLGSGPNLAHNLAAALCSGPLRGPHGPARGIQVLACGNRYAIGSWGGFSAQGRLIWWLKNWLDHRYLARFAKAGLKAPG
jgi:NADH dehydrogenase FAD-containing subunit